MSLEQVIAENNAILISIRDLLLSGKLTATPKVEAEQKEPLKPAKKVQAKSVEDKPDVTPKTKQVAQPAQVSETATVMPDAKEYPTEQELIKWFIELAKIEREAAVAILARFRVGKAVDVPKEKRAEFIAALKSKLTEIAEV